MKKIYKIILLFILSLQWYSGVKSQSQSDSLVTKKISDTVIVSMYVERISDIDFRDQQYSITFWLKLSYHNRLFDFNKQLQITGQRKRKSI